jgi:hypothetical protein
VGFFLPPQTRRNREQQADHQGDLWQPRNNPPRAASLHGHRLPINVDLLAIGIGLALAALIRFGVIHQISF